MDGATVTARWQFWIDRGGTFTDIVACRPDGRLDTLKLLSENPEQYADAAVAGIRRLLGLGQDDPISDECVSAVKMGTTVATNALLERKGEPTLLVVTKGFRDGLRIGYQNRPHIFDLHIALPELLYQSVIEADERIGASGDVVRPLDAKDIERQLRAHYDEGLRSVAIVLMHGYRYTQHELCIASLAREIGFTQVSVSHEVSPLMKWVSRGDTTVVDAYLSPILSRYVDQVAQQLGQARLLFMQSNGGLVDAHQFRGKDAILSGPAGGIVGMVRTAEAAGLSKLIGFDMGGTSTDVSHYSGEFEREFETMVAGVRLRAPMMSIHTVAAGGGSVLSFDGSRYRVGPESAGANPGPASYRRGGPLTVTDCNVMLGKIQPKYFPAVFGANADQTLDQEIVVQNFEALARDINAATGLHRSPESVAEGFIDIAVGNMANAIKFISVQRGHDVSDYTLCTFGGAGGQHACMVADALGIRRIFAHPMAGVLSAYGMGLADQAVLREQSVELVLSDENLSALQLTMQQLDEKARAALREQGAKDADMRTVGRVHVRYEGTDSSIQVLIGEIDAMVLQFERAYKKRYSFLMPDRRLIVEAISVEALVSASTATCRSKRAHGENLQDNGPLQPEEMVTVFSRGQWRQASLFLRENMRIGDTVCGPAIIVEKTATNVVELDWTACVTETGDLVIERTDTNGLRDDGDTAVDPVRLEIFNNLFMSIAEQMGLRLQNTAYSVNIKERLDFSCAIFDAVGNLVANAPHIPVHLGSMGESVKAIIRQNAGQISSGDVFMLNDPYHGGTHLPDITIITPVFNREGREILFYVASRGHHADIGGIAPGSMPASSRVVEEEGVLINNFKLVEAGVFRERETVALLMSGPYPVRNVAQNLADFQAQIAANQKGVEELLALVDRYGIDVVRAYMGHVQDNAEEAVRRVITALNDGEFSVRLDNGAEIRVAIRVDRMQRSAEIDFSGTSAQLDNNFNAPSAIAVASVLYVFRTLVNDAIPLNAGCLKPLNIIIPEGSMLNPRYPAAVVSGNVETSSCITNALYGALGVAAASPGTMNNFTFGNAQYQYYETISGGSGAGAGYDGTDVVQTHMTNSRLTDPEILEWRFPVRIESYEILRDSGGAGRWKGGNGGVRRIRFLTPMTASIISNNRREPPFGLFGGQPGRRGRNYVLRSDGRTVELDFVDSAEMGAGDIFVIETPGGGGYGSGDA